jgi:CRISPR-associated endonuclease Csn1
MTALGVRIYPDGRDRKDFTSLAAARRGPRAMRRNRDRYLRRRQNLLNALTRAGLMPADDAERKKIAALDPYKLRADALLRKLAPEELGRVFFHLNQHRGFKSNRRTDRNSNEGGLIANAAAETAAMLHAAGFATIGSWLAARHAAREGVRVRLAGSGKAASYPFYPLRAMVEAEFDIIWAAQSEWNPSLTAECGKELRYIIFRQRDLVPPKIGKCWLEPGQNRAQRALPSVQRFRIAQTLSHLRLSPPGEPQRALSVDEQAQIAAQLYRGKDKSFDSIRKELKLPAETDFSMREKELPGCATAARLGSKTCLGAAWHNLPLAAQDDAVTIILNAETDEQAADDLAMFGFPPDAGLRAAKIVLTDGTAALSARAIARILPYLEQGFTYDKAVQEAGYAHHSDRRTGEIRETLPYYGEILNLRIGTGSAEPMDAEEKRFGRAPNPTVHVALNELRHVVNDIVGRFGAPAEIVVESLRELGRSAVQRKAYKNEQDKNRDANDARRAELQSFGEKINSTKLIRLRLLEEQGYDPQNRVCPYTGQHITPRLALSDAVEEDHILPFSQTLDDSTANRVLVMRDANRIKARRTPYDAFGHTPEWPDILERIKLLPPAKRWRFQPDALARFAQDGDFLARHLTDSATIARWAVEYLDILAPGKVRAVPGRLTALLRHALGLNSHSMLGKGGARKDRNDHRHHAIDAIVIALSDRSLLQSVTRAAQRAEAEGTRLLVSLPPPWENFVHDAAGAVQAITISHKPDTGWQGSLHNDTAYGILRDPTASGHNVVLRRPLATLADWKPHDALASIRDPVLAKSLAALLAAPKPLAERKTALAAFHDAKGRIVRRVRMTEAVGVRPIMDRQSGKPYKGVKLDGNHCFELWRMPDGIIKTIIVTRFDAASTLTTPAGSPPSRPHPAAKLLIRLHKSDMVAFSEGAERRLLYVVKMTGDKVYLAENFESGNLKARDADKSDPFHYIVATATKLAKEKARKVFVTPSGIIRDTGPAL